MSTQVELVAAAVAELKNLTRTAKKVAEANVDRACDTILALLNHEGELRAAVEQQKADHAAWAKKIAEVKAEYTAVVEKLSAADETKRRVEAALREAQAKLTDVKQKLSALLA